MNSKKRMIGALISAGTTLTMVVGLNMGVAQADPIAAPTNRLIALSGSDTTDEVMQALSENTVMSTSSTLRVENWSAAGGAIAPHGGTVGAACNAVVRPNGSGAGRTALLNSIGSTATTPNCFQGARSSSLTLDAVGAADKQLVYVPFAKEAVTFAVTNTSNITRNQTTTRLQQFYQCQNGSGVVQANPATKVMLPQSSSGTRKFWLKTLLGSETPATLGTNITSNTTTGAISAGCVENGADEFGTIIQEHQGGQVNDNEMVPYSVGQWTSQASGVIGENRGRTILAQIDGTNPFSTGAAIQRSLYNVFPAADLTPGSDATKLAVQSLFFDTDAGPTNTAAICGSAASVIISRFGLFPAPDCGNTSQITPV